MAFFPHPYFDFSRNQESRELIVHEMAHAFDNQKSDPNGMLLSRDANFFGISWEIVYYEIVSQYRDNYVTRYAETNPQEDFAETATYYFFYPQKLKKISERNSIT